jgi:hypothetical protein
MTINVVIGLSTLWLDFRQSDKMAFLTKSHSTFWLPLLIEVQNFEQNNNKNKEVIIFKVKQFRSETCWTNIIIIMD